MLYWLVNAKIKKIKLYFTISIVLFLKVCSIEKGLDLLDDVVFWSGCKSKTVRPPQSNWLYFNSKKDFIQSDNFIESGGSCFYASSPSCRNAVWAEKEVRLLTSQSRAPSVVMETFAMRTDVDIPVILLKKL